jgi:hypothetical protein
MKSLSRFGMHAESPPSGCSAEHKKRFVLIKYAEHTKILPCRPATHRLAGYTHTHAQKAVSTDNVNGDHRRDWHLEEDVLLSPLVRLKNGKKIFIGRARVEAIAG